MGLKLAKFSTFRNRFFFPLFWSTLLWVLCTSAWAGDVMPPLTASELKTLPKEFQKAQKTELLSLEHRLKFEIKELKASQAQRQKEWEMKEREARHQFFKDNKEGPKRRAYVKDFLDRRKVLLNLFADERNQRLHEQEVHKKALLEDQKHKSEIFQKSLQNNERPPKEVWP